MVSSHALHNKMFYFVAQHHVKSTLQEFPLTVEGIKKATKKLADGEVRYLHCTGCCAKCLDSHLIQNEMESESLASDLGCSNAT
ncbi:hypothetical protein JVU11DRAFT_4329 [Chiua virens]|nr:hypothetical protein JVU11DRAFT_4329 [Chiua virens]